ncbi:hypothetical protein E8E95_04570 [Pseudomonas sp. BN414]|uniref:hypothetical protein n=1 Tax=Pseudomonas sp. BN414 TaxID=2567888 RepID=UPI0024569908|nr:hypothetical protein [Pseudomonas sp. BN414]MDH4565944.1 hypothetical protein [Pseudomonas sp. BN414]
MIEIKVKVQIEVDDDIVTDCHGERTGQMVLLDDTLDVVLGDYLCLSQVLSASSPFLSLARRTMARSVTADRGRSVSGGRHRGHAIGPARPHEQNLHLSALLQPGRQGTGGCAMTIKKRVDGQVTGLSGELFVAAELLKRGLQTSITFGNAKAIDLLAHNPDTGRMYKVQVKSIRKRGAFPINHQKVQRDCVYVFVVLNKVGVSPQYAIVPGASLADEPERFSKWFLDVKFPGFQWSVLVSQGFEDNWQVFSEASSAGNSEVGG